MAENGVDIAKAYVHLIPSMQGAQGTIADAIVPSASKAGDEAGKKAGGKFSGSFKAGIAAVGAAAATTAAFTGLWQIGETFDELGDTIRIGAGATGEDLEGLIDAAKNVSKTVPSEFGDIGTAVADINTRMGLSGKTMETVAAQYLQAGNILGEAVDIGKTSAAFSAFKIEGDGVVGAMDHLFQVSQATGVGMNELADAAQKNAPAMQTLGFSFEETSAMIGSFDKAGLNSTALMGAMGKGLVTLAKDGEEPQKAFKRVQGEIQGFIKKGDEAGALKLASKVFGTKGATQFVGALKDGTLNLADMAKAAGQTSDTILGTADETADFAESWQLVKNNAMLALEPLASGIFGGISSALSGLMPTLQILGAWLGENQWVLGVLAGIIGVTLVAAIVGWTTSLWAANAALLANPVTWIVIAILALIAGIIYLATQTTFFQDVWAAAWGFITSAIQVGADIIGGIFTWIQEAWQNVVSFFTSAVETIGGVFSGIASAISGPFKTAFNAIAGFWNSTVGQISFSVPDWVPGIGGKGWSVPNIPMLAKGGVVTKPTLAIVGEAGPEAVIPLSKLSQHMPQNAGGGGVTFAPTANTTNPDEVVQELWGKFEQWLRETGQM